MSNDWIKWSGGERRFGVNTASAYRLGDCDDTAIAEAFLAGARMATERERERRREYVDDKSARAREFRATLAKREGES